MEYYCFVLHPDADSDVIWQQLSNAGYCLLYGLEEPGQAAKIYGHLPETTSIPHPAISAIIPCTFDGIDWKEQWHATAGKECGEGILFDLQDYLLCGKTELQLVPGPGFGDLSHPTTVQTLRLMAPQIQGKFVLDVGCGSGILSLAAAQLGAAAVHGIDIDVKALDHARSNASRNCLKVPTTFGLPEDHLEVPEKTPILIAMNMITSEQQTAWASLARWHVQPADIITSGVLDEQRGTYLEQCSTRGWQLVNESALEGWLAFHFRQ